MYEAVSTSPSPTSSSSPIGLSTVVYTGPDSSGRQRLQARNPASRAARTLGRKVTFSRFGRPGQPGRQ